MTHNICFILLAVDKENNNDPLKIWGLYLFVLAFPGECVNQLGSEVKSIPERSAGWFKTLDVWHRLISVVWYKKNIFLLIWSLELIKPYHKLLHNCHISSWRPHHPDFEFFDGSRLTQPLTHWGRDKMAAFFADDIFTCIFLNEKVWISINISLKFAPEGQINKIPVLVQIMAWRRPGDKPLSEPIMFSLLTHICVTRPQWVNTWRLGDAYMHQWIITV